MYPQITTRADTSPVSVPHKLYAARSEVPREATCGGTECKKNLRRSGLRPGPCWGAYSAPDSLAAPPPKPHPDLGPSGLASPVCPLSASPLGSGWRRPGLWVSHSTIAFAQVRRAVCQRQLSFLWSSRLS